MKRVGRLPPMASDYTPQEVAALWADGTIQLIDVRERHEHEAGRIAGAGLDVYGNEPALDPRLLARQDVIMLPHMASATFEARDATGEKVIANIRFWSDGHRPPDQIFEGWV